MHSLLSLLFFITFSLHATFAQAEGVVIDSDFKGARLGTSIKYFEDKTNSYTFDYLSQRQSAIPWVKTNQTHFNFGLNDTFIQCENKMISLILSKIDEHRLGFINYNQIGNQVYTCRFGTPFSSFSRIEIADLLADLKMSGASQTHRAPG